MTTRAPGLTAAMRVVLERVRDTGEFWGESSRTALIVHRRQFVRAIGRKHELSPRGHAALAAPRMTAAEYLYLLMLEACGVSVAIPSRFERSMSKRGWLKHRGAKVIGLSKSGLTALNNMRAATGSAEYREDLK